LASRAIEIYVRGVVRERGGMPCAPSRRRAGVAGVADDLATCAESRRTCGSVVAALEGAQSGQVVGGGLVELGG
jgi:hypothetical protein